MNSVEDLKKDEMDMYILIFCPQITTTTLNNMFMQDHTHVILLLIKKKTLFVLSI